MPILLPILLFAAATAAPYDLVIRNGHVIDGTGSPWYAADIGIRAGKIAAIGHLADGARWRDRKSTRLNSSHRCFSYAVFCLKKTRRTSSKFRTTSFGVFLRSDRNMTRLH